MRFWRNLDSPLNTRQKIGLALLALFVGGFLAALVMATVQAGVAWKVGLAMVAIWGPIFAAIAWGTRRALRKALEAKSRKRSHH